MKSSDCILLLEHFTNFLAFGIWFFLQLEILLAMPIHLDSKLVWTYD